MAGTHDSCLSRVTAVTVRVRTLTCGWLVADAGGMVPGQTGSMRMPVGAFLVEHPDGTAVFDTGMHAELEQTKARMRSTAELFELDLADGWTLTGQLAERGLAPDDVDLAIVSHLHFDHCGGLAQLPDARLLVQQAEWDAAFAGPLVDFGVFNPDDFDIGHERLALDGEHDVFGDGSVVVVPTPGHTAGHQSLLVEGRLLLTGDACYCRLALDLDAPPGFGHDLDRQRQVFAWLRDQEASGVRLVFSHDADQWASLPAEL
jgi:glyoxylase-like metal-dependent hydrolase (beta-lactamase superfamily II)